VTVPKARQGQRGSVTVVTMVVMVSLITLGGMSLIAVKNSVTTAADARFANIALYAAESGVAVGVDFLRAKYAFGAGASGGWNQWVVPLNDPSQLMYPDPDNDSIHGGIAGNRAKPGQVGPNPGGSQPNPNLLDPTLNAWYEVAILNNTGDPEFAAGNDRDGRIKLLITGHGPNGARSVIQVELAPGHPPIDPNAAQCPGYSQKNQTASGSGANSCLVLTTLNRGNDIDPAILN